MRIFSHFTSAAVSACACFLLTATAPAWAQQSQPLAKQISPEERDSIRAVVGAPTPQIKLRALTAFLEKYPGSPMKGRLIQQVGIFISRVKEPQEQVPLAERFFNLVSSDSAHDFAAGILVDAYLNADRIGAAFQVADTKPAASLAAAPKNPASP